MSALLFWLFALQCGFVLALQQCVLSPVLLRLGGPDLLAARPHRRQPEQASRSLQRRMRAADLRTDQTVVLIALHVVDDEQANA